VLDLYVTHATNGIHSTRAPTFQADQIRGP
jgi:hypothetical protein